MNENQGIPEIPKTNEYSGVIGDSVNGGIPEPQLAGTENQGVVGAPYEKNHEKNKKSKKKFLIGALLILIIIAVALFFGYKKITSNPVTIYENTINKVYNFLHENLVEAQNQEFSLDFENEPFVVDLNANLTSTMPELSKFSGYDYGIQAGMDYKTKKANVALNINQNNTEIINALVSFVNNKAYLKSDKLINKVLDMGEMDLFSEMDLESITNVTKEINFDYDDIDYILKTTKDIIVSSLDREKFTVEKKELTINRKAHKVNKVTYILDKSNMERTVNHILTKMIENQSFLDTLAKISNTNASDIKASLEEALNEGIDLTDYETIYIVLYTNSLNITVAGELVVANQKIITFDCLDDKWNIFIDADTSSLSLNNNKEYTTISYKESNTELFNFKVYLDDTNLKLDYIINMDGKISGTFEIKDAQIDKNKITGKYSFSINTSGMTDNINLALSGKYKLEKKNIETINTSGSVAVDSLTEAQMTEFSNNLMSILERFGLSGLLGMEQDPLMDTNASINSTNSIVSPVY